MKAETRVIGIDDGNASRRRRVVIGAIFRGGLWLDGIIRVSVDTAIPLLGRVLGEMVATSRFYKELRFAILHGAMLRSAGLSILTEFNNTARMPALAILHPKQSKTFDCVADEAKDLVTFKSRGFSIFCIGLTREKAMEILRITCLRGNMPEPTRVAGLIASVINAPKRLNWTRAIAG